MLLKSATKLLLPSEQYIAAKTKKTQIVLHHTVSNGFSPKGDVAWWTQTKERVGAHFIVCQDGRVYQCIDTDYWVHHLGVSMKGNNVASKWKFANIALNQMSIAIELDSGGGLTRFPTPAPLPFTPMPPKGGDGNAQYVSNFGKVYKASDVVHYGMGYRGFDYYERYSDAQIAATKNLITELMGYYNIGPGARSSCFEYPVPATNSLFESIFDINTNALGGVGGIYTHTSYRTDKSDCHPQPELINMLLTL